MKVGSIIHKITQTIAEGGNWRKILEEVKKEYNKMFDEEKEFYGNLPEEIESIMMGYEEQYKEEKFKYLMIEETLSGVPLTKHTQLKLRPDKIVIDKQGLRFLWETKSGRKIPPEEFRLWDLQTIIYVWGARQIGMKLDGILWDYIRTKPPAIPKLLKDGGLSKRQDIDTTTRTYLKAIKDNKLEVKDYQDILDKLEGNESTFYRRMKLPIAEKTIHKILEDAKRSSLEIYYMQDYPVREISGFGCRRCFYKSLCYAELRGLDTSFIKEHEFKKIEKNKEEEQIEGEEEED
jgi:hypothetical protein